jgi:hypothetical protein
MARDKLYAAVAAITGNGHASMHSSSQYLHFATAIGARCITVAFKKNLRTVTVERWCANSSSNMLAAFVMYCLDM